MSASLTLRWQSDPSEGWKLFAQTVRSATHAPQLTRQDLTLSVAGTRQNSCWRVSHARRPGKRNASRLRVQGGSDRRSMPVVWAESDMCMLDLQAYPEHNKDICFAEYVVERDTLKSPGRGIHPFLTEAALRRIGTVRQGIAGASLAI